MVRKSLLDHEFERMMASHLPPRSVVHKRKRRRTRKKVRLRKAPERFLSRKEGRPEHTVSLKTGEQEILSRFERRSREERKNHSLQNSTVPVTKEEDNIQEEQEQTLSRLEKRKREEGAERERRFRLVIIRILTVLFILLPLAIIFAFFYFQYGERPANFPVEKKQPDSFEQVEIENKP